jgi:hypothetical protein
MQMPVALSVRLLGFDVCYASVILQLGWLQSPSARNLEQRSYMGVCLAGGVAHRQLG